MTEPAGSDLFPTPGSVEADRSTGLLPSQMLREAVALGREVLSPQPIGNDQIQLESLDLRLGRLPGAGELSARRAGAGYNQLTHVNPVGDAFAYHDHRCVGAA